MKDNKQLVFLSFGDVFYDQRLGRTIKTLQDAGFVIHVFAGTYFPKNSNLTIVQRDTSPYLKAVIVLYRI
jgi:hypothetical protein